MKADAGLLKEALDDGETDHVPVNASPFKNTPILTEPVVPHNCCVKFAIAALGGAIIEMFCMIRQTPDVQVRANVLSERDKNVVSPTELFPKLPPSPVHCPDLPPPFAESCTGVPTHPKEGTVAEQQLAAMRSETVAGVGQIEAGAKDRLTVWPTC